MLTARTGIDVAGDPSPDPVSLFSPFAISSRSAVVAAVSGGSDSTALLVLLKRFLDSVAPSTRLVAVTVDHRLRTASAAEAETVAALCRGLGVEHRIATWEGPKPGTGVPAAARLARYRLLAEAARDISTDLVFTGHTAEDQAETVLMRQARGAGRGLAGMAPATLFQGRTWIVRPLLSTRRQLLRQELFRRSIAWSEDPTNLDQNLERPRVRLAGGADQVETALAMSEQAAHLRVEAGAHASWLISTATFLLPPDTVLFDFWESPLQEAGVYAFRILLAVVGDRTHLPALGRAAELYARVNELPLDESLSGTLVCRRQQYRFLLPDRRGHFGPGSRLRLAPWADFLPSFDLAPARAVAELIGAPRPPDAPFAVPSVCHSAG